MNNLVLKLVKHIDGQTCLFFEDGSFVAFKTQPNHVPFIVGEKVSIIKTSSRKCALDFLELRKRNLEIFKEGGKIVHIDKDDGLLYIFFSGRGLLETFDPEDTESKFEVDDDVLCILGASHPSYIYSIENLH